MSLWEVVRRGGLIFNLSFALSAVAAIVAWRGSLRSAGARGFMWWLALGAVFNLVGTYFSRQGIRNLDIYHWYRLFSVLLLALSGFRLLSGTPQRRLIVGTAVGFVVFWVTLPVTGAESHSSMSRFLAPAETAFGLLLGLLLVAESMGSSGVPPFQRPESWLGLGLVLASGTTLIAWPIMAELYESAPNKAKLVGWASSLITDIALITWCIPYWKRSIVWTR